MRRTRAKPARKGAKRVAKKPARPGEAPWSPPRKGPAPKPAAPRPYRVVTLRFHPAEGGVETRTREVYGRLSKSLPLEVVASDLLRDRPFERLTPAEVVFSDMVAPTKHLRAWRFLPLEGYGTILPGIDAAIAGSRAVMVHSYGYHHADAAARACERRRIPAALTTHFHPPETAGHPRLRGWYDRWIGRKTLHRFRALVAMTDHEKEELARRFGYPADRIHVIPSGVDLTQFHDHDLPREPGLILFVGRLSDVKGLDLLVEALARVRPDVPEAHVVAVGDDWGARAAAEERAKALGVGDAVTFPGRVAPDELVKLYNRARVFALPSRYEAFGVAPAEAIACGTPCVASRVGGLPFVIGSAGLLVDRTVDAFADALRSVLTDDAEWRRLHDTCIAERLRFDWDEIAREEGRLLESLGAGR